MLPDAVQEALHGFTGGLMGIAGSVVSFGEQQVARFDEDFQKKLEDASPEERIKMFEEFSTIGDDLKDAADAIMETQGRYGSGSITTELAKGNLSNAAQLTANQTAQGLASLVPFMIPGGQVLGPAILGTSAAGSAFEEDLA